MGDDKHSVTDAILPGPRDGEQYRTSELAALIGKHANTLRMYEEWGFISPVGRMPNGYRLFTRRHALEALFAVIAQRVSFNDWRGRRAILSMIRATVSAEYAEAGRILAGHEKALRNELVEARKSRLALERWLENRKADRRAGKKQKDLAEDRKTVGRWAAARMVGVAPDTLRDWERDGLLEVGRSPGGRRTYTPDQIDLAIVIRTLRRAGHSLMGIRALLRGADPDDLGFARDRWEETLESLILDAATLDLILGELAAPSSLSFSPPDPSARVSR